MQVLVVGGAGYIGGHVTLDLLKHGHGVTVFDNLSTGCRENIPEKAHFVAGDLLQPAQLERLLAASRFEAVVHLAALKAAGDSMTDPEQYGHHNICGSISLLNQAARHGIRYFVFSSSAAVYGDPQYLPMDEKHRLEPTNFYGFTKLQFERQLAWFHRLRGMSYACLRYFNAAGYDADQAVKGLEINPKNLIPLVMEVATGRRKRLSVFGADYETADGTCIRDYIHVTDLADAHTRALNFLAEGGDPLTVNLGSEEGHSVLEVVRTAQQVTGRPIPYDLVGRRAGDPPSLLAAAGKARRILDWRARHSDLHHMLTTAWRVYRDRA